MATRKSSRQRRPAKGKIQASNRTLPQRRTAKRTATLSRRRKLAFDERYGENWTKEFLYLIHLTTGRRCCWCLKSESEEIHHAVYQDEFGKIVGRERAGVHIFPVCEKCHSLIHTKPYWIKDRNNPVWCNRNTPAAIARLKLGFSILC